MDVEWNMAITTPICVNNKEGGKKRKQGPEDGNEGE